MVDGPVADGDVAPLGRSERKRAERARQFLDAALKIVIAEGFESLTMQRLADEVDTAVSAVYRYYPSKGAILTDVQIRAVDGLHHSLAAITEQAEAFFIEAGLDDADRSLARLIMMGRWLCESAVRHPEEVRLLQMQLSSRYSQLDDSGGARVYPSAMELVGLAVGTLEQAAATGMLSPGPSIDRALIWAAGLGGVLQLSELETYSVEIFGGGRLARTANLDLLAGWGASREDLERLDAVVDDLAATTTLAP